MAKVKWKGKVSMTTGSGSRSQREGKSQRRDKTQRGGKRAGKSRRGSNSYGHMVDSPTVADGAQGEVQAIGVSESIDAQPIVGISDSVRREEGEAGLGIEARRGQKRKAGRSEVVDDVERELVVDSDEDCAVYDDDFDIGDDATIDGGDDDDNEVNNGLGVEEDVNLNIAEDFPEAVIEDEANDDSDADSGDDIWEEDQIPDPLSDDDEDDLEERDNSEGARIDDENPEVLLKLGKTYNTPDDFKLAVLKYSLKTRYDIMLYRSQAMRVGAKCNYVDDGGGQCPWRIYCSYERKKHKFQTKVYINEHTCVRSGYSKMLKCSSIALLFEERLRLNQRLTKYEMADEIKREYNLEVTPDQCAKAKTKVLKARKVSHEFQFARIWDYQAEVLKQNKDSEFVIETIPGPIVGSKQRFDRLYICFNSQKESWKKTCRPIIGLDGAFLKWDIKGHLLAAVGRDGDNRIVPLAWAVVEIENDSNWDWFVSHLSESLGLGDGSKVALISDKQSGLVKAIHTILPQAEHRQCAKHIMDNWKRDSHDPELQRMFWQIARSYTTGQYYDHLEELKRYNPQAYASLQLTNPPTWSRAFFRVGSCCNDNLNNLSESFNRTIRQARKKPLLDLLEDIRRQCMVRNAKRFLIADRMKTRFTKRAHVEIEKMIRRSQHCKRYMARNNLHEVDHNGVSFFVDMNEKTCGCRKWQMTGIPCIHAACVIIGKKEKVEDYVSDYYTKRTWRETYIDGIKPVQGMPLWPRMNRLHVLPPPWRRGNPGRPSNYARRKGRNESSSSSNNNKMSRFKRVMTCSNCKQEGHNKQGCKNATVVSLPKRPRGRPRKNQGPQVLESQPQQGSQVLGSQGHPTSQGQAQGSQAHQGSQVYGSQDHQASQGVAQGSQAH